MAQGLKFEWIFLFEGFSSSEAITLNPLGKMTYSINTWMNKKAQSTLFYYDEREKTVTLMEIIDSFCLSLGIFFVSLRFIPFVPSFG